MRRKSVIYISSTSVVNGCLLARTQWSPIPQQVNRQFCHNFRIRLQSFCLPSTSSHHQQLIRSCLCILFIMKLYRVPYSLIMLVRPLVPWLYNIFPLFSSEIQFGTQSWSTQDHNISKINHRPFYNTWVTLLIVTTSCLRTIVLHWTTCIYT